MRTQQIINTILSCIFARAACASNSNKDHGKKRAFTPEQWNLFYYVELIETPAFATTIMFRIGYHFQENPNLVH